VLADPIDVPLVVGSTPVRNGPLAVGGGSGAVTVRKIVNNLSNNVSYMTSGIQHGFDIPG
jgi:hypothetical protein